MTWILRWFLEDLHLLFNPHAADLRRLREGMAHARHRQERHGGLARAALKRAGEMMRRVRALEMSPDAPVEMLVAAHRDLMAAEEDLRHHHGRTAEAEEALRLMTEDRRRMESGEPPQHRDRYAYLLNR